MNWWQKVFGQKPPTATEQLMEMQNALKMRQVEKAKKLLENTPVSDYWLNAYTDILDRYRDGGIVSYPISQPTDRRWGSNFPFWTSEAQLSLIRAQSRLCVAMNPNAHGLLNGLTSYVVGDGFKWRVAEKPESDADEGIVREAQMVIDEFIDDNNWSEMEQELFWRSREDGEFFLRLFPQFSGKLFVRTVEPEQIIQKPSASFQEWSYGIQTDEDDVFVIKNYFVLYMAPGGQDSPSPNMGEDVPAKQMVHLKCNVKRSIKRGLADFSYDTLESFSQSAKLRRNLGEGAAVQAAIAAIRQHDVATAGQVETFVQNAIDYSVSHLPNQRSSDYQKMDAGSFLDIPKGMNYITPPGSANSAAHIEIFQALLRVAGNRHNAPEWLVSSDASNNNYASSLTAESPFLRHCVRLQKLYEKAFRKVMVAVLETAIRAGRLPEGAMEMIEVQCTTPTVETRDKNAEASANATYVNLGVKSRQTVAQEVGLDWDNEVQNNQDFAEQFGQQGQPLGQQPPMQESVIDQLFSGEHLDEAARDPSKIKRDKSGKFAKTDGGGDFRQAPKVDFTPKEKKAPTRKTGKAPAKQPDKNKPADTKKSSQDSVKVAQWNYRDKANRAHLKKKAPVAHYAKKALGAIGSAVRMTAQALTRALNKTTLGRKLYRKMSAEIKMASRDVKLDYRKAKYRINKIKKDVKAFFSNSFGAKESVEVNLRPPETVAKNAKRSLEVRAGKPASERGMTPVGIARARDLSARKELSPETVRRMLKYFTRHEKDKQGSTWDSKGKGWQAWMGWGGDSGYAWARKVVKQLDARTKTEGKDRCWDGYEPTPGKKPYSKGSCKPKTDKKAD